MKDSGIPSIGKIPDEWSTKKLKFSVFHRTKKSTGNSSNLPYVGLENVEQGNGKLIDTNKEMNESDAKLFLKGDVLFGKLRPYLAKVVKMDFDGRCSSEFLVLEGKDYDSKFLLYLLLSDGSIKRINATTYGAKMPRADWSLIGNMLFPSVDTNTQKIISTFLENETSIIDSQIQHNQKLIELLKEKWQTIINQAVTKGLDPTVPMKDSGIDWIGKIPEHWKVNRLKNVLVHMIAGPFGSSIKKEE